MKTLFPPPFLSFFICCLYACKSWFCALRLADCERDRYTFPPFFPFAVNTFPTATLSLAVPRQQIRSLHKAPFMIESLTFQTCQRCSYLAVGPVTYYSTFCFYKKRLNKLANFFQERLRYHCCIFKRSFNPWRKRNVAIYICMVIGFI